MSNNNDKKSPKVFEPGMGPSKVGLTSLEVEKKGGRSRSMGGKTLKVTSYYRAPSSTTRDAKKNPPKPISKTGPYIDDNAFEVNKTKTVSISDLSKKNTVKPSIVSETGEISLAGETPRKSTKTTKIISVKELTKPVDDSEVKLKQPVPVELKTEKTKPVQSAKVLEKTKPLQTTKTVEKPAKAKPITSSSLQNAGTKKSSQTNLIDDLPSYEPPKTKPVASKTIKVTKPISEPKTAQTNSGTDLGGDARNNLNVTKKITKTEPINDLPPQVDKNTFVSSTAQARLRTKFVEPKDSLTRVVEIDRIVKPQPTKLDKDTRKQFISNLDGGSTSPTKKLPDSSRAMKSGPVLTSSKPRKPSKFIRPGGEELNLPSKIEGTVPKAIDYQNKFATPTENHNFKTAELFEKEDAGSSKIQLSARLPITQLNKINSSEYAIEMLGITKSFGTIMANDKIDFRVKKGSVHALIGENGAGKSVLMSILFGLYSPDAGQILINGQPTEINSPEQANALGIGMVHQHFKLVRSFSVLENILLGNETNIRFTPLLNRRYDRKRVKKLITKYNLPIELNQKISNLSVSKQQRVEIIKMLFKESDILIFDEPTAVLTVDEISDFLKYILELKSLGKTIVIISHKLNELKQVADEGTVIARGKFVGSFKMSEKSTHEISEMMVGRPLSETEKVYDFEPTSRPALSVRELVVNSPSKRGVKALSGISFDLYPGEILALAGVEGNGQSEVLQSIIGQIPIKSGKVVLRTKKAEDIAGDKELLINKLPVRKRYKYGFSYIPEDRHEYGLIMDDTVAVNAMYRKYRSRSFGWGIFMNHKAIRRFGSYIVNNFDVRNGKDGSAIIRNLSGGNQQKVIIGREITFNSDIILIGQPTRGLDIGAIEKIHNEIREQRKKGKAIILLSFELEEVLALADRVLVFNSGQITGQLVGNQISYENIGKLMVSDLNTIKKGTNKHEA